MPKLSINQVLDAPSYLVDHFNGKYDTDRVVILRDGGIVTDTVMLKQALDKLPTDCKVLDMTNNDLVTVPPLTEHSGIHTLVLGRNRIKRLDGGLLPANLVRLSLAQNEICELSDLDALKEAPKTMESLFLRGNDVCYLDGYRQYVISRCPQLKVLDFEKVTNAERLCKADVSPSAQKPEVRDREKLSEGNKNRDKHMELLGNVIKKMDDETRNRIKEQLVNATTLDEIERLEGILAGNVE